MKKVISTLLAFAMVTFANAQVSASFSPRIKTLQVLPNGRWNEQPIIFLGGRNHVDISFDDLQASHERYTYTITHCNADWTKSDLLVSEYMTGFNDQIIEDYEPALGTEIDYCHYFFTLPNEETKLLMSGNYRVDIYEDDEDEPVAQACFSILEPRVGVSIDVSANTDIDSYSTHQQLSFSINYSGFHISNPVTDIKTVVMQNRRWDSHVEGLKPTYMRINQLVYEHQRKLIFPAGNEFRRFEMLDEYVPTLRVEHMEYNEPYYHAMVYTDEQRVNYLYDEDHNGSYLIRNSENQNNDTESDYFFTHFTLQMPQLAGGDVYLFGDLTDQRYAEDYKMEYNLLDHQYELALPLKQGHYDYMYMFLRDGDEIGQTRPTEGDFHQTENEYCVLVYHRPSGQRYDQLIGYQKCKYKE